MITTIRKKTTMRSSIIKTRESEAHKKSSNTARTVKRQAVRKTPVEFICIDGEGITDDNGNHKYVLIGCGDKQISNPDGLEWQEILTFLYSQFLEGGYTYTGFFLNYDLTQTLKGLPQYKAHRLLTAEGRAKRRRKLRNGEVREIFYPVDCDGWEFDILGTKRLKIRPAGKSRWMYICDTGPFFQKSFIKVIDPAEWKDPIVTAAEFEYIKMGKSNRATAKLGPEMRRYNNLENDCLSRVLRQLD